MSRARKTVTLTTDDRQALETILRSGKTEVRVARRARILLLIDEGHSVKTVAERVGHSESLVRRVCGRYDVRGLEAVLDARRAGRPAVITPLQKARLVNLACTDPAALGLHVTHWSLRTLRQMAIELEIFEDIHISTISVILRQADLQPHRHRSWKSTVWNPEAVRNTSEILDCYEKKSRTGEEGTRRLVCG